MAHPDPKVPAKFTATAPFSATVKFWLVAAGATQAGLIVNSEYAVWVSVPSVAVTVMGLMPVAADAAAVTVIVELTGLAPTTTVAGLKLAVAPDGSPEALKVTLPV